jgi:hypothetical protein
MVLDLMLIVPVWDHSRVEMDCKCCFNVETEDDTYVPEGLKRFITPIIRLSVTSRVKFPSCSENGLRELKTGLAFGVVRG